MLLPCQWVNSPHRTSWWNLEYRLCTSLTVLHVSFPRNVALLDTEHLTGPRCQNLNV